MGQRRLPQSHPGDGKDANHNSRHYYGRKQIANIRCSARDAHKILYFQVCTAFLALSLIEEGYTVYANADASGALSERISSDANDRMRAAGVHVLSSFAVVCDLMRDWRNTPGSLELLPYFDK